MPTQSTTYNSRLTDEALEKRFRETFRSQAGAELIDDLYASGVIVPVVDFTAAAQGTQLPFGLAEAIDFSVGSAERNAGAGTNTEISTPGFWRIRGNATTHMSSSNTFVILRIDDGSTQKNVFRYTNTTGVNEGFSITFDEIVFLRTGDSLESVMGLNDCQLNMQYRQVADVYGNITNPLGFVSQ